MTDLLRSNAITITTDRTRFYIATPGQAEPVPAEGAQLVLCREIAAVVRKRVLRWGDVLRVRAVVGELEGGDCEYTKNN